MKYKYRLIEQEEPQDGGEENGLKGIKIEQELTLTTRNGLTANKILDILKDPKYLSGIYISKSKELLDFEKKVFGDKPTNSKFDDVNKKIYSENGIKLYQEIETVTGKKFERGEGKFVSKKGLFTFPIKSPSNLDLIKTYLGEKSKIQIKPKVVNIDTLKFPLTDESDLKKILTNAEKAKVISSKDYSLERTDKLDEKKVMKKANINYSLEEKEAMNEDFSFNIDPTHYNLIYKIYKVLKSKYPQIGIDYTESAFLNFLNDNIK